MLRLEKIVINGVEYYPNEDQQPEGLFDYAITTKRNADYYGMDIFFDLDVKFYCSSFKDKLDQTFLMQGIDNEALFYFEYQCGGWKKLPFVFTADWKTYNTNTNEATVKLVSKSAFSEFLDIDDNSLELNESEMQDAWVRKVSVPYVREAVDFFIDDFPRQKEFDDAIASGNTTNIPMQSVSWGNNAMSYFMLPQSKLLTNELETGYEIIVNDLEIRNTPQFPAISADKCFAWAPNLPPFGSSVRLSLKAPQPIFTNDLENGILKVKETGLDKVEFEFLHNRYVLQGNFYYFRSILVVGDDFLNPRKVVCGTTLLAPITFGGSYNVTSSGAYDPNGSFKAVFSNGVNFDLPEVEIDVKKNENVWHIYELLMNPNGVNRISYTNLKIRTFRKLTATFNLKNYDVNSITDVKEPSHVPIKVYEASNVSNQIFSLANDNFFTKNEFNDFYFTNGSYVRRSVQPKKLTIKPKGFFKDLESIAPVGLGLFYNGTSYELNLDESKAFWTDNVYEVFELIDDLEFRVGAIGYNDLSIGYETYKETTLSKHKKNEYNIRTSKHRSKYTKLSKFIADAYIWAVQIVLGTDIDGKPNDDSIFILSAKNLGTSSNPKIVSLSNSSGFASDGVIETNSNSNSSVNSWLNRRYSSVFNLIRKSIQWLPSLEYGHTSLFNNSVYDSKLKISNSDYIINVDIKQDQTLTTTELINAGAQSPFENIVMSFSTPMNDVEYYNMTENWYDLIGVKDDKNNTYYGHILSAKLSEGVCSFELLKNK